MRSDADIGQMGMENEVEYISRFDFAPIR
jgi:hypothetical protein